MIATKEAMVQVSQLNAIGEEPFQNIFLWHDHMLCGEISLKLINTSLATAVFAIFVWIRPSTDVLIQHFSPVWKESDVHRTRVKIGAPTGAQNSVKTLWCTSCTSSF